MSSRPADLYGGDVALEPPERRRWLSVVALTVVLGLLGGLLATAAASAAADDPTTPCDDDIAFDGETGRLLEPRRETVIQILPFGAICELEQQIIAEIAAERGLALTPQVRAEILSYGRGVVRDRIFNKLIQATLITPSERTAFEQELVEWLDRAAQALELRAAEAAIDEYEKWRAEPCDYVAPEPYEYVEARTVCASGAAGNINNFILGAPRPPSLQEFVAYGQAIAFSSLFEPQGTAAAQDYALATISGQAVGTVVPVLITLFTNKHMKLIVLPFREVAKKAGAKLGSLVVSKALGPIVGAVGAVVVAVAVEVILGTLDLVADERIPQELAALRDLAAIPLPEAARRLLANPLKAQAAPLILLDATTPDLGPDPAAVPASTPPASAAWFRIDTQTTASSLPSYSQVIRYQDPIEGAMDAWLLDRWWVRVRADRSEPPELVPALRMLASTGPQLVVYDGEQFRHQRLGEDAHIGCPGPDCKVDDQLEFARRQAASADAPDLVHSTASLTRSVPTAATIAVDGPAQPFRGDTVTLHGAGSEPDGEPLKFAWAVYRDGDLVREFAGRDLTYTFTARGAHVFRLRATDPTGLFAEATHTVDVTERPILLEVQTIEAAPGDLGPSVQPLVEGPPRTHSAIRVLGEPGDVIQVDFDLDLVYDESGTIAAGATSIDFSSPGYPDEGRYPVRVRRDRIGFESMVDIAEVEVVNWRPGLDVVLFDRREVAGPGGVTEVVLHEIDPGLTTDPYDVAEGTTLTGSVTARDLGADVTDVLLYWSDGTFERLYDVPLDEPVPFSHTFGDDSLSDPSGPGAWEPGLAIFAEDEDGSRSLRRHFFLDLVNLAPSITSVEVRQEGHQTWASAVLGDPSFGDIERATIDFGDGSVPQELLLPRATPDARNAWGSADFEAFHEYSEAGDFTVTVTAWDDGPEPVVATQLISTVGPPPRIDSIDGVTIGRAGDESRIDATLSDLDPSEQLELIVDWGDGTTTTSAPGSQVGTHRATHTYAAQGEYRGSIIARDPLGNTSGPVPFTAEVENGPPSITVDPTPATIQEGSTLAVSGSFSSADGGVVAVDWGDGSGLHPVTPGADGTFSLTHTYDDEGTYSVEVTPVDGLGLGGTAVVRSVDVLDVAGVLEVQMSGGGLPTERTDVSATVTDPGDSYTVTVDWGDGTTSGPGAAPAAFNHVYVRPGTFQVVVTAVEGDGTTTLTEERSIVVSPLDLAVLRIADVLRDTRQQAPVRSQEDVDAAIDLLDGRGRGDAVDALRAGDQLRAATRIRDAVIELQKATADGAGVRARIADLVRIQRAIAVAVVDDAEARGARAKPVARARVLIADGDARRDAGDPAGAARAYRSAVEAVFNGQATELLSLDGRTVSLT